MIDHMKRYVFKSQSAFDAFILDNGTVWAKEFEKFVTENKLVRTAFFYSKDNYSCFETIRFFNGLEFDTSDMPLYIFSDDDLEKYCKEIDYLPVTMPDVPLAVMPMEPPTGMVFNLKPNSVKLNLEVTTKEQAEAIRKLLDVFFE